MIGIGFNYRYIPYFYYDIDFGWRGYYRTVIGMASVGVPRFLINILTKLERLDNNRYWKAKESGMLKDINPYTTTETGFETAKTI